MYITRRNRITVFENEMLSNLAKLRSCLLVVQRGEEGGAPVLSYCSVGCCRVPTYENFQRSIYRHKGKQRFREHMELAGRDGRIERATAAATLYGTIIASSTYTNSR